MGGGSMFAAIRILILIGLSLLCHPVWAAGMGDIDKASNIKQYRAVGDNAHAPLVFMNAKGSQDGYDIEFLHLIEKQGAIQFTITLMDWNDAKESVADDSADILIGIVKTLEREEVYDFTEPYLETRLVIFSRENNFSIKDTDDLVNRRTGVQRGDLANEFLRGHIPSIPIYQYTNQREALKALAEGKVDAVVGSYFTGMYWINQYNWQDSIKVVGEPLAVNSYALGIRKGNPELLAALNEAISSARKSGKLQQLQDKWFGENYFSGTMLLNNPRFIEMIRWAAIGIVLLISVGALFVYSLRRKVKVATDSLREANQQLVDAYDITIRAFFSALEQRESGTAHHSLAVNSIALEIGREMELSTDEMLYLHWGTLLHDIGKLAISDEILLKEGTLTDSEYANIKRHPSIGYEILQGAEYLHEAAQVALYHQERYDGTGYPQGLAGNDIPLLARICSVADAYEAMISNRPYRKGRSWQEAVEEIAGNSGSQFDPQVVAAFLKLDHCKYTKTTIKDEAALTFRCWRDGHLREG
jgi:putative nucleotidyltransferase with HDIG domain